MLMLKKFTQPLLKLLALTSLQLFLGHYLQFHDFFTQAFQGTTFFFHILAVLCEFHLLLYFIYKAPKPAYGLL